MSVIDRIERGELGVFTAGEKNKFSKIWDREAEFELLRLARLGEAAEKVLENQPCKGKFNDECDLIDCAMLDFFRLRSVSND